MSDKIGLEPQLYLAMDAWRGVGAMLIVVAHSAMFWGALPPVGPMIPYLVDMFFMFSGFVVAFAFEPRLRKGRMDAVEFMRQRLIRLFPLFLLGVLLGLAVRLMQLVGEPNIDIGRLALEILPQLVMAPSFVSSTPDASLFTLNLACWSLFFELFANTLFILLWPLVKHMRGLVVVVLAFAGMMAASIYVYGDLHVGYNQATFPGGFARGGVGFFLGVLVYRLMNSPQKPPADSSWLALLMLPPCFLLYGMTMPEESRQFGQLMLVLFVGPAWMILGLMMQPPRMLQKLSQRLGAMSYALYVIHVPIILVMMRIQWAWPEQMAALDNVTGAAILAVSLALAYLAEKHYDRPLRQRLLKVTKKKRPAALSETGRLQATAPPSRHQSTAQRR